MSRVAQADLFAPPPRPASPPGPDPVEELTALLERLQASERLPWADAAATMAEEHRAIGLARLAGVEGEALVQAIMVETERLLAATDHFG